MGKARDHGIRQATGKYIMFVDPDDWIDLCTINVCVKFIEKYNADLVEFGYQRKLTFDENPIKSPIEYHIYESSEVIEANTEHISCNKLYVTDIIRDNRIEFCHRIFEDTLFTRKYSMCCKKAVVIRNSFYSYFVNSLSLTSTMGIDRLQQNERTEEVIKFYEASGLIRQKQNYIRNSRLFLIRHLIQISRQKHQKFIFSSPHSSFARHCQPYIDKFNRSGILFRLSAYRILSMRSAIKLILKHGI